MPQFGFEYFSGANILVRVGDMPILEAAGLSVSIAESKRPIYGYSRRFFSAVASGQVLAQGQLAINYVHQDYLYHAVTKGLGIEKSTNELPTIPQNLIPDYWAELGEDPRRDEQIAQEMKNSLWSNPVSDKKSKLNATRNLHDNISAINLYVTFGEQDLYLNTGKTGYLINSVYFLGRSQTLNIDEHNIVEIYPFLARDIQSIVGNTSSIYKITTPGENNSTTVSSI